MILDLKQFNDAVEAFIGQLNQRGLKLSDASRTSVEKAAAELIKQAKEKQPIPTQCKQIREWLKAYAAAETDEERWALL